MHDAERIIARLAASQHGIVSRAQLLESGFTRAQVDDRVAARLLVRVFTGVYRHAAWPLTRAGRLSAASLACGPGAVISHRSAGRVHDLRDVPASRPELTVPTLDVPVRSELILHRTNRLEELDITVVDGLRVTTVARTLLDLGAVLPAPFVTTPAQDAIIRGLTSEIELVCLLERLGGRGRRGTRALREIVEHRLPPDRLQSHLELALYELVLLAIPEPPELQYEVVLADGRVVVFDFAWPARRLVIEADGRRWHSTTKDFERDLDRWNAIVASGWHGYRYGWTAVHQRRAEVLRSLATAFQAAA